MADQSKLCVINNNSGRDTVVRLAVAADETTSPDAVISFDKQMEILKTSSGNTIIKNGSSDSVTLDHSYQPPAGETGYVQNYDLVISDSNWLFPIAHLPVVQQGTNGTASYAPQTVGATDSAAISEAFNFYQNINAYPNSQLTKDYMVTVEQAQQRALSDSDIENAMAPFFKGLDLYKDVTWAGLVAVEKYYNSFPCVWAQYLDTLTYYLYARQNTMLYFTGILSLDKSGALDITKPNSGYTCSFVPSINFLDTSKTDVDTTKALNLTYINGIFLDDINTSTPKIALKGNFQLKRVFTNNPNDTMIIPVITGMANGMTCTGIEVPVFQY